MATSITRTGRITRSRASMLSIKTDNLKLDAAKVAAELSSSMPVVTKHFGGHSRRENQSSDKLSEALASTNWRKPKAPSTDHGDGVGIPEKRKSIGSSTDSTDTNSTGATTVWRKPSADASWDRISSAPHWKLKHDEAKENYKPNRKAASRGAAAADMIEAALTENELAGLCGITRCSTFAAREEDDGTEPRSAPADVREYTIVELTPVEACCTGSNRCDIAAFPLAEIRRIKEGGRYLRRRSETGHFRLEDYFQRQLERVDLTPRKSSLPVRYNKKLHGHERKRSEDEIRALQSVLEDPAVESVRGYHVEHKPESVEDKAVKNQRFQALLGKLKRSAAEKCIWDALQFKDPAADSEKPRGSKFEQTRKNAFLQRQMNQRFPPKDADKAQADENADRTRRDSHDSAMTANLPGRTHQKQGSQDSAINIDSPSKSSTLNPKAREFLSMPKLGPSFSKRISVSELFESAVKAGEQNKSADIQPPMPPMPPMEPTPGHAGMAPPMPPMLIGGTPGPVSPFPPLGAPFLPMVNGLFPPPPGLPPPMACPAMPPPPPTILCPVHAALGFPNFNMVTPPPVMMPGMQVPPPPPVRPARKPKGPDAGGQQAYEAWIEWRKTNEPGYAMECKMRQAKRAQRIAAEMMRTPPVTNNSPVKEVSEKPVVPIASAA